MISAKPSASAARRPRRARPFAGTKPNTENKRNMQIQLDQGPVEALECDALVALTFDGKPNERFQAALGDVYASGEATGKMFEMTLVHWPAGLTAKRLLLVGAGPLDKFTTAELRRVAGA